jgi:hypothetical protein
LANFRIPYEGQTNYFITWFGGTLKHTEAFCECPVREEP